MKFGYAIIYVSDVPKVLDFYLRAFGFKTRFLHESNQYGELSTGDTVLAFASHELGKMNLPDGYLKAGTASKPFGVELAFVTEDVEKAFKKALAQGAIEVKKPVAKPWGQVVAYVRDIEGTLIELCTPVSA